ncbi:hypothetical protein HNQ79_000384 [Streptomyces candidus]|uniref:Uncharacterized protein n=1 Tax=Streptomyces candidus TaxID=67283 RepID=A0A7X0HAM3_9ACTN|nr:hypothetical protein [Streptomyces candidus]GHH33923.1 hypothetical protein GCM10018773_05260 [Streptomyces candidus]
MTQPSGTGPAPGGSPGVIDHGGVRSIDPYASRNVAVSGAETHLRRLVRLGHAEAVPGGDPVTYIAV